MPEECVNAPCRARKIVEFGCASDVAVVLCADMRAVM